MLDCTLRDGGYCNNWEFGYRNIKKIASGLVESGIDIIECGFISDKSLFSREVAKYNYVSDIDDIVPANKRGRLFVAMINYGEYIVSELPNASESRLDGIRLAFHKKDIDEAIRAAAIIHDKGYLVFLQPMVSLSYSDREFLDLIDKCNGIDCYAFYIVDSFGLMNRKDLMRLFYLVDHNLKNDVVIGFHSHNNMQLAYSNAQALSDTRSVHNKIIDASIYGMGRGAGNLNTELFVKYLNDTFGCEYKVKPLLNIIDEILDTFYKKVRWGYSLPNYLSGVYNTHPNYATFLSEKNALTIKEMDEIFSIMDDEKRVYFDKEYIESLYFSYLSTGNAIEFNKEKILSIIKDKAVLLIAPGPGSKEGESEILAFRKQSDIVVISVNFRHKESDFVFVSNFRRFRELSLEDRAMSIVTSNIPADNVFLQTDYSELLNDHEVVQDNAGLMAIAFLIKYGVTTIYLAGFDGYSYDAISNYGDDRMTFVTNRAVLDAMNEGMTEELKKIGFKINLRFLIKPKFLKFDI